MAFQILFANPQASRDPHRGSFTGPTPGVSEKFADFVSKFLGHPGISWGYREDNTLYQLYLLNIIYIYNMC